MLRTHRQANQDDGAHRLRQLWLAWLALVVAMFAASPAPNRPAPLFVISCTGNAETRAGDLQRRTHPAKETNSTAALVRCVQRIAQPRLAAPFDRGAATRIEETLREKIARQILPGWRRLHAVLHRRAPTSFAFAPV